MNKLIDEAYEALKHSYSPYSNIKIGAAVTGKSGRIYRGTNIENAAYGSTICAERVAIFKAISEGESDISAIAVTGDFDGFAYPCGACRQVMSEFMKKDAKVYVGNKNEEYKEYQLDDMIPFMFTHETKGKQE
ncbi:MAG: cytidine deaminase [Clostridia bacterium]|nr:cytidine deaminase [Clostridia bacterium]